MAPSKSAAVARKNTITVEAVTAAMGETFAFDIATNRLLVRYDLLAHWAGTTQQLSQHHHVDIMRKRGRAWLVNHTLRRLRGHAARQFMDALAEHGVKRAELKPVPKAFGAGEAIFGIPDRLKR